MRLGDRDTLETKMQTFRGSSTQTGKTSGLLVQIHNLKPFGAKNCDLCLEEHKIKRLGRQKKVLQQGRSRFNRGRVSRMRRSRTLYTRNHSDLLEPKFRRPNAPGVFTFSLILPVTGSSTRKTLSSCHISVRQTRWPWIESLTPFFFMYITRVRPFNVPTLKNWTSLLPLSFWGVRAELAFEGFEGTNASTW